jgi:prepilin-type N-terminal cleavage/methylation domain-containing protein
LRKHNGFTLIELMVAVAVLAIVMAIGVPSMRELIQNNRLVTHADDIAGIINFARAEAIQRRADITLTAGGGSWGGELTVTSGDQTLRVLSAAHNTLTITNSAAITVVFDASGANDLDATEQITVCDDRAGETGRRISLLISGVMNIQPFGC